LLGLRNHLGLLAEKYDRCVMPSLQQNSRVRTGSTDPPAHD